MDVKSKVRLRPSWYENSIFYLAWLVDIITSLIREPQTPISGNCIRYAAAFIKTMETIKYASIVTACRIYRWSDEPALVVIYYSRKSIVASFAVWKNEFDAWLVCLHWACKLTCCLLLECKMKTRVVTILKLSRNRLLLQILYKLVA